MKTGMSLRTKIPLLAVMVSALVLGPAGAICAADLGTATSNNVTKTGNAIHSGGTAKKSPKKK